MSTGSVGTISAGGIEVSASVLTSVFCFSVFTLLSPLSLVAKLNETVNNTAIVNKKNFSF